MEKQPDAWPVRIHAVMLSVTAFCSLVPMAQGQGVGTPKNVSSTFSLYQSFLSQMHPRGEVCAGYWLLLMNLHLTLCSTQCCWLPGVCLCQA